MKHAAEQSGRLRVQITPRLTISIGVDKLLLRLDKSVRYVLNHKLVLADFKHAQRTNQPRTLIPIGGMQRW
jgi:hypothetical protein